MNIGIDIDDTIANTYETFFAYVQKYILEDLHKVIKVTDEGNIPHSYHYANMNNLSENENMEFLKKYIRSILSETKPKTFCNYYIQKLHDENNKIFLITSRFEQNRDITENWLKVNNFIYDKLIMHCEDKEKAFKENNIDVFIDDNINYCKQAYKNNIKTFLMDTRPNRNISTDNIKRVYSWPHLYYELKNPT